MRIVWHAKSIALQDDFVPCKANIAAKEQFIKAVFGYVTACLLALHANNSKLRSRSMKRVRDAAQQFILIARGLEGTGFGYTSVTM